MIPRTDVTWTKVISLIRFRLALSSASTYIVPCSLGLSGKIDGSGSYSGGMNDLQVLEIINRLKLSREHVVSSLGMVEPPRRAFLLLSGKPRLLTSPFESAESVHFFYYLE